MWVGNGGAPTPRPAPKGRRNWHVQFALRWLQCCVFAQERQDRRLAAEHVERNRMMRAALQACRQWCGRQHEKRAAELIEWKCARCAQRYSQTVAGCDVSARGSARFTGGPGRYGAADRAHVRRV